MNFLLKGMHMNETNRLMLFSTKGDNISTAERANPKKLSQSRGKTESTNDVIDVLNKPDNVDDGITEGLFENFSCVVNVFEFM
jgi:hypothetical protein